MIGPLYLAQARQLSELRVMRTQLARALEELPLPGARVVAFEREPRGLRVRVRLAWWAPVALGALHLYVWRKLRREIRGPLIASYRVSSWPFGPTLKTPRS